MKIRDSLAGCLLLADSRRRLTVNMHGTAYPGDL